ncbi:MAG TPA: hypothetical protein VFN67_31740 [Polyangiales bacterium]|nr:hypothetical protein [Polyangiales bacterium]
MRARCWQLLLVFVVSLPAATAWACGVSGPDGVWSCSFEEHEEELRPRWNVGVAGMLTATSLRFGDAGRGDQSRTGAVISAAYAPTPRLRLQASVGAALGGELRMPNGTHRFKPGPTAAVGVGYRLLSGMPFLALTAVLSTSTARTHHEMQEATRYTAFDLRLGAAFGATFFDALSPYALARVFGGPVFWRYEGKAVTGTDAYHFQVGAGLAWRIVERIDVFIEGVPLGERVLSGGASAIF